MEAEPILSGVGEESFNVPGDGMAEAGERDQYQALKQAVNNARTLWKIVAEMERVSRQVLFATLPDTRRRKRLSKRVLGLI